MAVLYLCQLVIPFWSASAPCRGRCGKTQWWTGSAVQVRHSVRLCVSAQNCARSRSLWTPWSAYTALWKQTVLVTWYIILVQVWQVFLNDKWIIVKVERECYIASGFINGYCYNKLISLYSTVNLVTFVKIIVEQDLNKPIILCITLILQRLMMIKSCEKCCYFLFKEAYNFYLVDDQTEEKKHYRRGLKHILGRDYHIDHP